MTLKEAFGRRLREARFHHGRISQAALAERSGVHRTQISLYETGQREPLLETLVKLAEALGIDPGELVTGLRP